LGSVFGFSLPSMTMMADIAVAEIRMAAIHLFSFGVFMGVIF
jgi:hypothetical protein